MDGFRDTASRSPEVWAGFECAVVRVGDRIVDELALTGHVRRRRDIERLAELGVRRVRYPVLWERIRSRHGRARFDWADRRLESLRAAGIAPIVALFHHGTGLDGEVLEPGFPDAFADYARSVASRYPWVRDWLPVNEIMTNARFCGLYGHWYPHARSTRVFTRVLLNQLLAVRAATRAIRSVRSDARILVAEDLGTTMSTPELAEQASFDRARRWLVLDLLTGRVPDRRVLRWLGAGERGEAAAIVADLVAEPASPDVIGLNRYITSDRFLDHRLDRYPAWTWGGNGRDRYADVELVRVAADGARTWSAAIGEVWSRYRRPVALTEVHLGGETADQVAWWNEAWDAATAAALGGIPVPGVTSWAAVGSWDWPALLTRPINVYEPGAWDLSSGRARPTPLSAALAASAGRQSEGTVVSNGGLHVPWWHRPDRLLYPPVTADGLDAAA
jgi:dTDP-4-dehydrorhamnose reductase